MNDCLNGASQESMVQISFVYCSCSKQRTEAGLFGHCNPSQPGHLFACILVRSSLAERSLPMITMQLIFVEEVTMMKMESEYAWATFVAQI